MMNGSFKRNYEGGYHCSEDDIKAMIRDVNDSGNDSVLVENYTMDDIDTIRMPHSTSQHLW